MIIRANDIVELVEIVYELVTKSIQFVANKKGSYWEIELTGGY